MSEPTLTEDGIDLTNDHLTVEDLRAEGHLEVVAETGTRVVFRDNAGHELKEWADALCITRHELSERMHELAREDYGRSEAEGSGDPWSVRDPLVIAK